MKKFSFRLQSVLDVRTLRKRMAERDVAATRAALERNSEDLEGVRQAYRDSFRQEASRNTAFTVAVAMRFRQSLQDREQQLLQKRQQLTETLKGQVANLTRRTKDEMVIAKLEEHQRQEHRRLADQVEQAEIEEIDILKRGLSS